tara:strand:- start:1197 stop:2666 length:1470 start_codon:yes stop_codon:yes gene_type:complete
MGAYENPRVIIPPDYGEIFRKNFEASKAHFEAVEERARARREKIKKEQQQVDDRILQFDLTRQDIKAGDLTTSLQNATNFLADDYAENERLYSENKISREEYNKNRLSHFRKLNEMKQIGTVLTQQSKIYKNFDKSAFQKNGGIADGLFSAYEKGEVKFQFVGDDIEMYYKNGDDIVIVDTDNLKENDFFNINEKYIIDENEKKAFVSGIQLTESFQTATNKDGKQITQSLKTYDKTEDELINDIASSGEMNAYFSDVEDAGSIFVDSVYNPSNLASIQSSTNIIAKKYGLSEEETKQFKAKISEGSYDEILIGKNKNYRELVNEVSKLELAKESFKKYAPKEEKGRAVAPLKNNDSDKDPNNIEKVASDIASPLINGRFIDEDDMQNYFKNYKFSGKRILSVESVPDTSRGEGTLGPSPFITKIKITFVAGTKDKEEEIIDLSNDNQKRILINDRVKQLYGSDAYADAVLQKAFSKINTDNTYNGIKF